MRKENGEGRVEARELNEAMTATIVATPEEAREAVERILELRRDEAGKRLTIVIDGAQVKAQENFARYCEVKLKPRARMGDFQQQWLEHDAKTAVEAGLFVAILNEFIEEIGADYDTSWEGRVANRTASYRADDMDKIDGAVTAWGYIRKAVETLGLEGATLIIMNFDKLDYPGIGREYDEKLAQEFMQIRGGKLNTILFISPEEQ